MSKKHDIFKSTDFGLILLLFWLLEALKIYASCTFKRFSVTVRAQNALFGVRHMRLFPSAYPHPYSHPTRLACVRDTAPVLPCSLGCVLEVWGAPSHLLAHWAGSVVRLTLDLPFSVLWDLQPERCFFLLLSSLSSNWKKKLSGKFLLFLPLSNCSVKWCHQPRALTGPWFRHGCCRCAFLPGSGDLLFVF